ncbi:MAG: flippase-like domain-containing protein [Myxococcota bacterium]|nr:flippase-like domain-containing protein [Myxococcota bacterium]
MGRAFQVFRALVLVGGLVAFGFLVHRLGWSGITRVLGETGLWFVVVAAIDVGSALCDGAAIHRLARVHGPLPYRRAVAAQLGGVAINRLTPGNALGEPIKVSIIVEHVPRDGAVSAIMMFDVAATCIAVLVIVIGVPLTLFVADLPPRLALIAWIGAGMLLAFGIALVRLVRRGVLGTSIRMLARLRLISAERAAAWTTATRVIDTNIADLGKPRSRVAFAFLFGSRALHWAGTVVLLHASGLPLTAPLVIGMLSVGLLVQWASQIVPLGLGLADGGNYLLYAALGAPAAAGLDFSMVNRARTCVIAGIGLTVLAITSYVDRRRRAAQE